MQIKPLIHLMVIARLGFANPLNFLPTFSCRLGPLVASLHVVVTYRCKWRRSSHLACPILQNYSGNFVCEKIFLNIEKTNGISVQKFNYRIIIKKKLVIIILVTMSMIKITKRTRKNDKRETTNCISGRVVSNAFGQSTEGLAFLYIATEADDLAGLSWLE